MDKTTRASQPKKVVLVNPPSEFRIPVMPIGLASIAAYLKSHQIEVSAIDAWAEDINGEKLENRIKQSGADVVGVYVISPRYDAAKSVIETARRALPDSVIVAGGPHPSAMPAETLKDIPQLDICAIGEGEITMFELVQAIENNSPLSEVNGLAYRNSENREITFTKPRAYIQDLDILPMPARELFPMDLYYNPPPPYGRKKPYLTISTARGCPFHCTFCSKDVYKDTYRARSAQKVCDELEEMINKYGAQEVQFHDDDFVIDSRRAEEICDEIIKRGIKLRWSCLARVSLVNEKILKKMKQAGCWNVGYGVESGNQQILEDVNKQIKIDQIVSAFAMTKKAGLTSLAFYIVGLPGETKETMAETVNLIKKIKPDFISCSTLIVYPGSRLFKLINEGKYSGKMRELKKGENPAGIFYKGNNYIVLENNLSLEEMKEMIKKTQMEFYLRPSYILQSLKNIRSFSDFSYYFKAGFGLVRSFLRK